jgi:hypothetical protein
MHKYKQPQQKQQQCERHTADQDQAVRTRFGSGRLGWTGHAQGRIGAKQF